MTVKGIRCNKCGAGVYSRSLHDFRWCPCKSVAIDGGRDYMKVTFEKQTDFECVDFEVLSFNRDADVKKILFDDWNLGRNEYGLAEPGRRE